MIEETVNSWKYNLEYGLIQKANYCPNYKS